MKKPRVVFYLPGISMCGGVKVILTVHSLLLARGWDTEVFTVGGDASWFRKPTRIQRFPNTDALGAALGSFVATKIMTWWETWFAIRTCHREGDRWLGYCQDIETSYYPPGSAEAAKVLESYRLGLTPLTEGAWVHEQLRGRFGLAPEYVGIGLEHEDFRPLPAVRNRDRVLCQYRTWGAGTTDLKGWRTTRDAVLRAWDLDHSLEVVTFGAGEAPSFPRWVPHVHVPHPSQRHLRELFCTCGVFLFASNHEGFGLPAAEAMACGAPVVATRARGNEEFCKDGETCLLADAGDPETLARHVNLLRADHAPADRLGEAGRAFVARYRWDGVADRLEEVFTGPRPGG